MRRIAPTAAASRLDAFIERERVRVDEALASAAAEIVSPVGGALRAPLEYALSTSGKRLRPILFLSAYRAVAAPSDVDPSPTVYRLACAAEIVHTYSLVHDDLPSMDDDDLRRGRATVHRVHGVAPAMLAGAALLPIAMELIVRESRALGFPPERGALLVRELCRAAGADGMVGGQLLDLEAERRVVDETMLEAIHRAKTGALLTASLRLGAIAGDAPEPALEALTHYGEALGLAFQIADDILDVTGDAASLGKEAGRDRELRKASYPSLYGLAGAQSLARRAANEAKQALGELRSPVLLALADYVVERRS
ncbi:MAG: polyprenyl synthetase family protein [Gemmatimonadetes bacterium]|nr:polyprenyl synthetase family protein [Gemmatimonadota bacterium]